MEEVRDLLLEQSSGQCEIRPLFREPGLEGDEGLMSFSPLLPTSPFHAGQVEEGNLTPSYSTGLRNNPQQQHSPAVTG